jgi:hypothetical protein
LRSFYRQKKIAAKFERRAAGFRPDALHRKI